ncbi:CAAX amino terminal protease family protein [Methanosarcina lacustris Z-7289]|uniref:CAAX amino terminal protease family protein n=1 Tax=Methanosarcina lacustris Z-7289 TaxID=1434111 RepID=A0A0E3WTF6_9EURY|nr:CPBP family intramembrane glutamic endopeptidase [Methanosarcina lacustris]AKB76140.1 CAAX amino terminal protease family protein [Methanosarcina lacustris Z-7289]
MENPELPAENKENVSYWGTENQGLVSLFEEKKASYETEKQGTAESGNLDIRDKDIYVGIPILTIAFAEMLIYSGRIKEAVWLYLFILMGLSLSITLLKNEEVRKTYQALMLLPLLRLVSISMPVFFDTTLYSFVFIYATLAVPVAIAAVYQHLTLEEMGITFRRIWLYFPLSVLIGAVLGVGEYMVIRTDYLIPDLSPLNLLKLTVVMVFFVGLVEEVIFRSFIQTRLNKIFGAWEGILLSSMLFGIMHSGYGTSYEVLYTSFVGVIIGYMFYKTRSLPLITLVQGFINVFLFGIIPHLGPGLGLF